MKSESNGAGVHLDVQDSKTSPDKNTGAGHKSDGLLLVVLLQLVRAMMNATLIIIVEIQIRNLPDWVDVTLGPRVLLFIIMLMDMIVAWYCWTRKRAAWGLAIGFAVVISTLPWTSISILAPIVLLITMSEIILLFTPKVRNEFSVNHQAQEEPIQDHAMIFWVVIIVQIIKSILVVVGGIILFQYYGLQPLGLGSIIWIYNIPHVPLALFMGGLDFVIVVGLFKHKKWSYDMTLAIASMGAIESIVAYSIPVFYVSTFLMFLLLTKSAKASFG